jgi:DNA-binding Lrp family transcriptional regulator
LDDKDFRILVELFRDPLASHTQLGRAASVSAQSAQRRLQVLQDEFVLAGYFALPSAEILGRNAFIATASPALSESLFPMKLLSEKDVVWAVRKHDGTILLCIYLPIGTDPAAVGLNREAGWSLARAPKGAGPEFTISETDGRIIDALIEQPRAEIADLAKRTGLPIRTVQDRRDALISKKAFTVRPALLMRQGPGLILFHLEIRLAAKEAAPKVRAAVDRGLVIQEIEQPPTLIFLCRAFTVPGVYDMQSRLAALPEVKEVSFTIYREAAIAHERLHGWVREAVAQGAQKKPTTKRATRAP